MDSRADCTWDGDLEGGSGTVRLATGLGGDLPVTWASRTHAPDGKTSPEELLAAAHSACFCMAFSLVLAQNGFGPGSLDTTATATFVVGQGITTMALEVVGRYDGIDQATFAALAEKAHAEVCPVSQALKGNVEVSVAAKLG